MTLPASTLQKLRELAKEARPGPWHMHDSHGVYVAALIDGEQICVADMSPDSSLPGWYGKRQDAAFIAAANPTTVLALLDEIDALRSEQDALRGVIRAALLHLMVRPHMREPRAENVLMEMLRVASQIGEKASG